MIVPIFGMVYVPMVGLWFVPIFGMVYACTPIWNGLVDHGGVTVDLHMQRTDSPSFRENGGKFKC